MPAVMFIRIGHKFHARAVTEQELAVARSHLDEMRLTRARHRCTCPMPRWRKPIAAPIHLTKPMSAWRWLLGWTDEQGIQL